MLQEILKSYDDEKISELSDSALRLLERLSPIDWVGANESGVANEKSMGVQLQGTGINLWNKAVALKSAGAISLQLNAQGTYVYPCVLF